ncbi:MAG: hypothetical protein A2Z35_03900 [Actinobacteria bacterium RBG_19FT_COMBO_36_27]|nr:MAG: hypothetical protein A2Z35_03900 [Actinobacteria bacterium RBG_19FT_COMBO_36_27]
MNTEKKFDSTVINFVIGGAIIGAIAGYLVKKIGAKNIMNILKQKEIIPPSISNLVNEFTSKKKSAG